jgi:arginase family enzyme
VRDVLNVLARVEAPVVGADIVELNPLADIHDQTAVVAAKLAKELAALLARE